MMVASSHTRTQVHQKSQSNVSFSHQFSYNLNTLAHNKWYMDTDIAPRNFNLRKRTDRGRQQRRMVWKKIENHSVKRVND